MMRIPCTIAATIVAVMITGAPIFADSPAGKEIAEVIVQGNRIHTREQIIAQIDTRAGAKYDAKAALEDVNRLLALGWFPPSGILVSTQIREDGKVIVSFNLKELPTIQEIAYRGAAHLSKDELDKLTNLKTGTALNSADVQQARQAILRKYQEQGHNWATVDILEGNNEQDTRVVFDIAEGPKTKIGSIEFVFFGPNSGDLVTGRLRVKIGTSRAYLGSLTGDNYSPVVIEQDIEKICELYHNIGCLDVRVQRELVWSKDSRTVKIIFHIEEGPRFKVAKVQIDGSKTFDETKLLSFTDLHIGDYYSRPLAKAGQERIRNFYRYQGWPVTVRETVQQAGDGLLNVRYQIEEKEPQRIPQVLIYGGGTTKDDVIRREPRLYPGGILSYPELIDAENRFKRLGILEDDPSTKIKPTVNAEHPKADDDAYKSILVRIHESPTGSFMLAGGVTSECGLTDSVVVSPAPSPCPKAVAGPAPMSLADVAAMASGGVSDEVILNQMHTTGATFALCTEDILFLRRNQVSDHVVMEMQNTRARHDFTGAANKDVEGAKSESTTTPMHRPKTKSFLVGALLKGFKGFKDSDGCISSGGCIGNGGSYEQWNDPWTPVGFLPLSRLNATTTMCTSAFFCRPGRDPDDFYGPGSFGSSSELPTKIENVTIPIRDSITRDGMNPLKLTLIDIRVGKVYYPTLKALNWSPEDEPVELDFLNVTDDGELIAETQKCGDVPVIIRRVSQGGTSRDDDPNKLLSESNTSDPGAPAMMPLLR
jgi:Surface antigen variable number repeat